MKLCTECQWDGWDRIVDIYTDTYESLPEYINADNRYKIVILEKGILNIQSRDINGEVKAPALILLSQKDEISYKIVKAVKTNVIFFNPDVIREEFSFERIDSGEFEACEGQVIYQDYILIKSFMGGFDKSGRVISLPVTALKHINVLFASMDKELRGQKDGFWPCRSRSFLMEILHFVFYSFYMQNPDENAEESGDQAEFAKIAEYLEQHMSEPISLSKLTTEFAINRNKLNELFMNHSSMTCMNYLLNLRIDLAKILLSKTELPIGEISSRVGYPDSNYFTKVFKDKTGKTPSAFRRS